jgi:hypothetical protein
MPVEQTLREAAQFVLETMFFAESEPAAAQELPTDGQVGVQLSFDGQRRGRLVIQMPGAQARGLAGAFEGFPDADAVPAEAVEHVTAELANMVCGATLARLDPDGLFTLHSPSLTCDFPVAAGEPIVSECWLQVPYIADGLMYLALALEEKP